MLPATYTRKRVSNHCGVDCPYTRYNEPTKHKYLMSVIFVLFKQHLCTEKTVDLSGI